MRRLYALMLAMLVGVACTWAADDIKQANDAYGNEHYNKALELYLKVEKTQGTSSDLCYNIANTYYRLKDTPHAILYYERALILDPGNSDARFNLGFCREKAAISEESGDTYFTSRLAAVVSALSSNTWACLGVVSFLLFILALATYIVAENVTLRKVGFFGGIVLLVLSVVANVCAFYVHGKAVNRNSAIVTGEGPVTVSTAPRVPKDKSEVAFEIKEGYKVEITDSVVSQGTKWLDIETSDLKRGWINAKEIERI